MMYTRLEKADKLLLVASGGFWWLLRSNRSEAMEPSSPSPAIRAFIRCLSCTILRFPIVAISVFLSCSLAGSSLVGGQAAAPRAPTPTPWPEQFHSVLVANYSGKNEIIDLWYDWPNGRNFNIIRHQMGALLYDLEWNNRTSFFYTLAPDPPRCRTAHLEVGILRPNWLDGAAYLGKRRLDGFLCHVWTKADFIWYYEDVASHAPVFWRFYTGRAVHVMTFEVGAVLEDSKWQAPAYCFSKAVGEGDAPAIAAAALETRAAGMREGPMEA